MSGNDQAPQCPVCNDTGVVSVQDAPMGNMFPASDVPHVETPVYEIPCPMPPEQHK